MIIGVQIAPVLTQYVDWLAGEQVYAESFMQTG